MGHTCVRSTALERGKAGRKACTLEGPTNSSGAQSMGGIPSQRWAAIKSSAGQAAARPCGISRAVPCLLRDTGWSTRAGRPDEPSAATRHAGRRPSGGALAERVAASALHSCRTPPRRCSPGLARSLHRGNSAPRRGTAENLPNRAPQHLAAACFLARFGVKNRSHEPDFPCD